MVKLPSARRTVQFAQPVNETIPATAPTWAEANPQEEFVIDKLMTHGHAPDGKLLYKVRWYGYEPQDDTWKPTSNFLRSAIVRYYRRRGLRFPSIIYDAVLG